MYPNTGNFDIPGSSCM